MQANRGFALAASMMVLALISVLGAMAIQSATLEVQISAHDRDARAALYVAEAALDEARYYVVRGWGKLTPGTFSPPQAQTDLTVVTQFPAGFAWVDHRYPGFTLVDASGREFPIIDNLGNVIRVDTSAVPAGGAGPAAGRFTVLKTGINGTSWDNAAKVLRVGDPVWAAASGTDTWAGWTVWDSSTPPRGYTVTASSVTAANEVELTVPALPSAAALGTLRLGSNPWLSAMLGGTAPAGDDVAGNGAVWDRIFRDPGGAELGRGAVSVAGVPGAAGSVRLTSRGTVGAGRVDVALTVIHAGSTIQTTGEWRIESD